MSQTVVVADRLPDIALDALGDRGLDVTVTAGQPPEALRTALARADGLVVRSATKVTADLLADAPQLRAIARAGTGVDTIDVPAATARGIVVMNSPGANAVSVAELAVGLLLALVRHVPAADQSMKAGRWEKSRFTGGELQGRTLGLIGFGRIGQEVARRARAFEMDVVAHDPYISEDVARDLGVTLLDLDGVVGRADVLSLHAPRSPETTHVLDAARLARCRPGVLIVNTARGELIEPAALVDALRSGQVGGAAVDVHAVEPPDDYTLQALPNVVATPHIAASTREGQARAGLEAIGALCDYLLAGRIRNAVNAPGLPAELHERLAPFVDLAGRLGRVGGQIAGGPIRAVGVRTYGSLTDLPTAPLTAAALVGVLAAIRVEHVTVVNARQVATDRGIEIIESQSTRPHPFADAISLKVHTGDGERWLEGTVVADQPRLVRVDDVGIDAPLSGTVLLVRNDDRPGVVGSVGTLLGRHGLNIASFNLGRSRGGAIGLVSIDDGGALDAARRAAVRAEILALPAIRDAVWLDVDSVPSRPAPAGA